MAEGLVLKVVDQGVAKYFVSGNIQSGWIGGAKFVDQIDRARVFELDEAIKLEQDIREGFRWGGRDGPITAVEVDEKPELIKVEYQAPIVRPAHRL